MFPKNQKNIKIDRMSLARREFLEIKFFTILQNREDVLSNFRVLKGLEGLRLVISSTPQTNTMLFEASGGVGV